MIKVLAALMTITSLQIAKAQESPLTIDRSSWSIKEYWEETEIDFHRFVTSKVNNQVCSSDKQVLIACMDALSTGLEILEGDGGKIVEYKPASEKADNEFYPFVVTTMRNVTWEEYKEKKDASYVTFLESKSELTPENVNVVPLLKKIVDNMEESEKSFIGAMMYNKLMSIALDPHSYITPRFYVERRSQSSESKKVIGIRYEKTEDGFYIIEVVEGSAADKVGIKPGDIITKINGDSDVESAIEKTEDIFQVRFKRGKKLFAKTIEKQDVTFNNVTVKTYDYNDETYLYIELKSYSDPTLCTMIKIQSKRIMEEQKIDGVILDVRGNGGGRVDQAVCLMSLFLEDGSISWGSEYLYQRPGEIIVSRHEETDNIFGDLHAVTLIDGRSASASEATAIFLKDYRKSFILGERSFGKGTMQNIFPDRANPYVLHGRTVAKYYGPKGVSPQLVGVKPDFKVYRSIEQKEDTPFEREEDLYMFPIENEIASNYVEEDRKEEIKTVESCTTRISKADEKIEALDEVARKYFDLQLEKAKEVLNCANENIAIYKRTDIDNVSDLEMVDSNSLQ